MIKEIVKPKGLDPMSEYCICGCTCGADPQEAADKAEGASDWEYAINP